MSSIRPHPEHKEQQNRIGNEWLVVAITLKTPNMKVCTIVEVMWYGSSITSLWVPDES